MKMAELESGKNAPQIPGAALTCAEAVPKVSSPERAFEDEEDLDALFEKKLSSLIPVRPGIGLENELEFELS